MKLLKNKLFWKIVIGIICILIGLGIGILQIIALIKYVFG